MKPISFLLAAMVLCLIPKLHAQDAAVEERLNKLSAQIDDLKDARAKADKQLAELTRELSGLRDQLNQPNANYASQDDVRKLGEKLQEMDKKREADKDLILREIEKLGNTAGASPGARRPAGVPKPAEGTAKEGYVHTVAKDDTVSTIAQAYRERGINVTVKQILKANPSLIPEQMQPGQKVFIPAPPQ